MCTAIDFIHTLCVLCTRWERDRQTVNEWGTEREREGEISHRTFHTHQHTLTNHQNGTRTNTPHLLMYSIGYSLEYGAHSAHIHISICSCLCIYATMKFYLHPMAQKMTKKCLPYCNCEDRFGSPFQFNNNNNNKYMKWRRRQHCKQCMNGSNGNNSCIVFRSHCQFNGCNVIKSFLPWTLFFYHRRHQHHHRQQQQPTKIAIYAT